MTLIITNLCIHEWSILHADSTSKYEQGSKWNKEEGTQMLNTWSGEANSISLLGLPCGLGLAFSRNTHPGCSVHLEEFGDVEELQYNKPLLKQMGECVCFETSFCEHICLPFQSESTMSEALSASKPLGTSKPCFSPKNFIPYVCPLSFEHVFPWVASSCCVGWLWCTGIAKSPWSVWGLGFCQNSAETSMTACISGYTYWMHLK